MAAQPQPAVNTVYVVSRLFCCLRRGETTTDINRSLENVNTDGQAVRGSMLAQYNQL